MQNTFFTRDSLKNLGYSLKHSKSDQNHNFLIDGNGKIIKDLVIPKTININGSDFTIKIITNNALEFLQGVESITLPDTITFIGDGAFRSCPDLKTVKLSKNLEILDANVFACCQNLENIEFGDKLTKIGNSAFAFCCNLKSINLPDSIEEIHDLSFQFCKSLEDLKLPKNLKKLGIAAIAHTSVKEITLPDSLEDISQFSISGEGVKAVKIIAPISLKPVFEKKSRMTNNSIDVEYKSLDFLIEKGKSFKEINNILKETKDDRIR